MDMPCCVLTVCDIVNFSHLSKDDDMTDYIFDDGNIWW